MFSVIFPVLIWLSFAAVSNNLASYVLPAPINAHIASAIAAQSVGSSMNYTFSVDGTLAEAPDASSSWSPYWWVNSGAYLRLESGRGKTQYGTLAAMNPWRLVYARANPTDTDSGYRPQNIFRLVTRSQWDSVRIESKFKINRDNFSSSPNRNASNGLLLMSRYRDGGETLYYAGVRVDGDAVIKKKKNGVYTTLAQEKLFPGTYAEDDKKNLLPHDGWLSLRTETTTNTDGSVTVRLYVKKPGDSSFVKVLEAKDTSSPITGSGALGIRTDFMDVEFDDFRAEKI